MVFLGIKSPCKASGLKKAAKPLVSAILFIRSRHINTKYYSKKEETFQNKLKNKQKQKQKKHTKQEKKTLTKKTSPRKPKLTRKKPPKTSLFSEGFAQMSPAWRRWPSVDVLSCHHRRRKRSGWFCLSFFFWFFEDFLGFCLFSLGFFPGFC